MAHNQLAYTGAPQFFLLRAELLAAWLERGRRVDACTTLVLGLAKLLKRPAILQLELLRPRRFCKDLLTRPALLH